MAPVTTTTTGILRQPIDDPELVALIQTLSSYNNDDKSRNIYSNNGNLHDESISSLSECRDIDIEGLVGELERFDEWKFTEQVDLFEWIQPLDAMDSALCKLMKDYPSLFLIATPIEKKTDEVHPSPSPSSSTKLSPVQAESESQVDSVPLSIRYAISTILRFLSILLRNSYNKHVFNSVNEITAFLAAADDEIESCALDALSSLAIPSQIHRMSVPDTSQNGTVLHNLPSSVTHSRVMMLAKGWGSRGTGLGLDTCVMTDDSISGQGSLPQFAGEVSYEFLPPKSMKAIHVHLSADDICLRSNSSSCNNRNNYSGLDKQVEKKRKTATATTIGGGGPASRQTKSTSYLFFHCLEQIGGRDKIGREKLFELLVHIRLAKAFHSRAARIQGVKRRLCALLTMVHSHPSHDILAGYFHAQPELCVELTDLIRPIVSQATVSSVQSLIRNSLDNRKDSNEDEKLIKNPAVQSLVDPDSSVPFETRILALEVMTALVWRKDDGMGNGVNIARQADVLGELGVTKGQFSGLLATLIRYSLASLKSIVPRKLDTEDIGNQRQSSQLDQGTGMQYRENCEGCEMTEIDFGLEVGVAFVNTIRPKPLFKQESSEGKALDFISCVLSLAFAVVTASSGTQALTECGLIPVLVSTIALDNAVLSSNTSMFFYRADMMKLVIAQSIQLLEGAISNHNQALLAFHELNGIEILIKCLITETKCIQSQSVQSRISNKFRGPDRVLMYSLLNCLTIVCHLQETSSRSATFSHTPGDVLRRKEMTDLLIEIMDNVSLYGGVLGSLAITFLGDTMNSDPRVVRYVYDCGLADSFFRMLKSGPNSEMATALNSSGLSAVYHSIDTKKWHEPRIPPSSEIIASLPGVITALALTEEGRKRIADVNPIPEIFGILCSPKFAMPESRCLAGDMSSIIGSGLDELIRHVPSLKGIVIEAIVLFLRRVVFIGENVVKAELDAAKDIQPFDVASISKSRVQFMHFTHNANQILEQILQNDEQCLAFADAGGVEVLLKLHPLLMTSSTQFLAHISSQSSPSVAILSHSTTAVSIATAIKRVASNSFETKVIKQVNEALGNSLDKLEASIHALRVATKASHVEGLCFDKNDYYHAMNTSGILEAVPHLPLHLQLECSKFKALVLPLSIFLRDILNIEWTSLLLASILKMPQGADLGTRYRNQWQFTTSNEFNSNLWKLSTLYRTSCFEVCRVRTGKDFNERDAKRWHAPGESDFHPAVYKLRIVCAEGAVLRDGIDIDSCASVGGLEMGEEIDAFDRCINGSGILRYRTAKGWVSEQTRGNSREPISEVLEVRGISQKRALALHDNPETKKAIDCGIVDLLSASASILARLQNSQCVIYTSLSRAIAIGLKTMASHSPLFGPNNSSYVGKLTVAVSKFLRSNLNMIKMQESSDEGDIKLQKSTKAMYLANALNILHSCIYEERRDKQFLNVLVVCNLLIHDGMSDNMFISGDLEKIPSKKEHEFSNATLYGAIQFVLRYCLEDLSKTYLRQTYTEHSKHVLIQSKVVASCFLPTVSLLRRFVSQTLHIETNIITSYLYKLTGKEFLELIGIDVEDLDSMLEKKKFSFRQESFARSIHFDISIIAEGIWSNKNLKYVPPHLLNPILSFMNEVFVSLENSINTNSKDANEATSTRLLPHQTFLRNRQAPARQNETLEDASRFQASEEIIQRMMDMGFPRNHVIDAIESSRSNVVEIAMEYALLHPPSTNGSMRETGTQRSSASLNTDVASNNETVEGAANTHQKISPNDIDLQGGTNNSKELSESDRKKLAEKLFDDNAIDLCRDRLKTLKDSIVENALSIIDWPLDTLRNEMISEVASTIETNAEVINVLVGNFILDLYDRYPNERPKLIDQILDHLKGNVVMDRKGNFKVKDGRARNFASMCHVIVVLIRALPEARSAFLQRNLLSSIIQSLRSFTSELKHSKSRCQKTWPCWLAPVLLIVNVMAEPISLEKDGSNAEVSNNKGDYERVIGEHRRQRGYLAKTSKKITLSLEKAKLNKKLKQKESKKEAEEEMTSEHINAFTNVPTYAPLLTQDMCESVMVSCLHILRSQQKHESNGSGTFYITPKVAHALLLALAKVLRFQRVASSCLRMGGVELLLSLQRQSRFKGHVHLVTIVFRTLMEDETTLQSIMESEIRTTVQKLIKKGNRGSSVESSSLTSRSFVENVSNLICRDPIIFLKAAVSTIKVIPSASGTSTHHIELLSQEEKAKNTKVLSEVFRANHLHNSSAIVSNQRISGTPAKSGRHQKSNLNLTSKIVASKSPCSGSKKAQKKEKLERYIKVIGSPANHVMSQLVSALLRFYSSNENEMKDDWSFLSTMEFLEIIGDLLLVAPACVGAILNFQINGLNMKIKHALSGCLLSSQNIVNFLIHEILPQARNTPLKDENYRKTKAYEEEVRSLYIKSKMSQNAARILVVLVARAGEGRRRVISELSNAFKLHDNDMKKLCDCVRTDDKVMWALNCWGELILGLAAPRRHNQSHDSDSTLSFEVVKIMQDHGLSHALINGIKHINLEHPLAARTAASLLRPLENFTRPTVINAIENLVMKSDEKIPKTKTDDTIIADAFDAVERDSNWLYNNDDTEMDDIDQVMEEDYDELDDEESMNMSDENSEEEEDDEDDENSQSDEDDDSEEDDEEGDEEEEISSDSDSDSDEVDDDTMDLVDVHNADHEEMDEDEENNDHIDFVPNDYDEADEPDNDFFEGNNDVEEDLEGIGDVDGEDWTTIETGFGNQLGSRNATLSSIGRPRTSGNMVGAFMETAETVIGNILRSGGLHMDEIAEIEGTLGIRLTNNLSPPEPFARIAGNISSRIRASNNILSSQYAPNHTTITGTIPTVTQSNPPDNFFLSIGGNIRMGEPNFMEYQYGGTPLGADNREYFNGIIASAYQEANEDEAFRIPSSFDSQLFPHGSAASTHHSSTHANHPLLSGIQLPPVNALVARITRQIEVRNQTSHTEGRGWTEIRLGGNSGINIFERRHVSGRNVDARQTFDPIAAEFTNAFEQAFIDTSRLNIPLSANSDEDRLEPSHQHSPEINVNSTSSNELVDARLNEDTEATYAAEPGSNNSDGDNVATSLAAGLRLSNHSESEDNDIGQNNNESQDTALNDEHHQITVDNEDGPVQNQVIVAVTNGQDQRPHDDNSAVDNDQSNNSQHIENVDQPQLNNELQMGLNSQEVNDLVCPPGMDVEVFSQLPAEMQQEIIREHQATESVAAQLDASSGLDPEALAALPEDMRREVIAQEQNDRRIRQQEDAPADPSNAEEMDNASFIASLAPDLRREILLTADESIINTLPPDIVAEAQLLRERERSSRLRRDPAPDRPDRMLQSSATLESSQNSSQNRLTGSIKRRNKTGKVRVECEREYVIYKPKSDENDFGPLLSRSTLQPLLSLMYLLSPVRPQKLLQKFFQNLIVNSHIRHILTKVLISLLNNNPEYAISILNLLDNDFTKISGTEEENSKILFPPSSLLGTTADILEGDNGASNHSFFRRRRSTASAIALNLPISARCAGSENSVPPVVERRLIGTLTFLTKSGGRISLDILNNFGDVTDQSTCFDDILGLLRRDAFMKSSSNLEDLLTLIESICMPLSSIPSENDNYVDVSKREIDAATENGKEWVDVPQPVVSPEMLKLLCMTLRLESCKDGVVVKVNNIAKRLCKISANRSCILQELASVAQSLGVDAKRDLRALRIRLNDAVDDHQLFLETRKSEEFGTQSIPSTTVTLSASSSEVKLLRVLQTLHSLCSVPIDDHSKRHDGILVVSEELVNLLRGIDLASVWEHLSACLYVVSILEGARTEESKVDDTVAGREMSDDYESDGNNKKLQSSVAGLLSRFLPIIEAFFVVNASTIETSMKKNDVSSSGDEVGRLLGGKEMIDFVASNKVLLNAILRSNPSYLEKGLRAMVRIPQCRPFLEFDVKRHWFRSQVGRLRKHAIRRHGTLRLTIRRQYVFEDAYHQLRLRDADEMRGRLHITFVNEEGVDAGGLSREFFGILAKEMFNPNYALFTSTEDGCTFQPNPHSSINPDHLSYFHFVGRIVGKALSDGFLLDAHFTRSLYKHMIGLKPTYHDMQAIDPDYYKNLKTILEYNLEDIGVELTFSAETQSFGRSHVVDLIPNGRSIKVNEENKEEYVSLVCQHRMTTAIETQIKAYLEGFYELVKPDLISIFTAKELELLISGMPDIDIHDLKKNTDYQGYRATDKEIGWFWNIMFSLNQSEKAAFLQFTTGSSKVPLNGFAELQGMRGVQKFSIHKVGGGENGALMSAHTCFNSLDLPVYPSEEIMKEKLLIAIKEGGGAFLFS